MLIRVTPRQLGLLKRILTSGCKIDTRDIQIFVELQKAIDNTIDEKPQGNLPEVKPHQNKKTNDHPGEYQNNRSNSLLTSIKENKNSETHIEEGRLRKHNSETTLGNRHTGNNLIKDQGSDDASFKKSKLSVEDMIDDYLLENEEPSYSKLKKNKPDQKLQSTDQEDYRPPSNIELDSMGV